MRLDYKSLSDSELLNLLTKGKPDCDEAFKVVYKKYASALHAYCYKLIHDKIATEDIFQDTFIKFFQNVSSRKPNSTISGFLFTIARNLCFNYLRDKKNTVEIEDFHLFTDRDDIERNESYKFINIAMDLLEMEYREPLVLRMYDGLSYNEIAEICNITPETARQRVFRAKDKMKSLLQPYYSIKSVK
ncbi:MAG: sigma-70 family RNA polymerase sigma factor [Candidatus Kapabacteria bacterium]|jgi:RNA polymerase sigma-70 factor (ECF subfamily)|nr:sigma-70 family RNA polymerase sigma factor [Candidatus Kapabacteria bacterium]